MKVEAGGRSVQVSGKLLVAVFVLLFMAGGLAEFVVFQNVTFTTNVPLVVPAVIDGSAVNLSKSQSFMVGSTHSVGVPSVLNLTSTTDYAFVKWSDGVTQASRQFTVPTGGATLTAMYQRRMLLTVVENATEGTISSSGVALAGKGQTKTAWVVAGSNVTLSEAGNPSLKIGNSWHSFIADGWKVNDIRQNTTKSSFSLVMNEPMIVSGVFFDPSASQTATGGLWQEMKPCSYYIFPDTAATVSYYAQDCNTGAITYGGSGNAGGATGTNGATVAQNALNGLTTGRTYYQTVAFSSGIFTFTTNLQVPSWVILDFSNANITATGTGGVASNKNYDQNTYDKDSEIQVIGGIFTCTNATQCFNWAGVTNLQMIRPTQTPPASSIKGSEILLQGANKNVYIDHFTMNGPTANVNGFNYGVFIGPSNAVATKANKYVTVAYPYLRGISGDGLYVTGTDITVIHPTILTVGNSANSNKNDIGIDIELNTNIGAGTTNQILIDHPYIAATAGAINSGITIGSSVTTSVVKDVRIIDPTIDLSNQATSSVAMSAIVTNTGFQNLFIQNANIIGGQNTAAASYAMSFDNFKVGSNGTIASPVFQSLQFSAIEIGATSTANTAVDLQIINPGFFGFTSTSLFPLTFSSATLKGYFTMSGGIWDKSTTSFLTGTSPFPSGQTTILNVAGYNSATNSAGANLAASVTTTSGSIVSSGFGVAITPKNGHGNVYISACANVGVSLVGDIYVTLYRTTGSIPLAGSAVTGSALTGSIINIATAAHTESACVVYLDTGLTTGTAYNYYLAWLVTGGGTGTMYSTATSANDGTDIFVQEQ